MIERIYLGDRAVKGFEMSPRGIISGDYIIDYSFTKIENGWEFTISTVSQSNEIYNGDKEVVIKIRYHDCWLEDEFKKTVL